MVIFIVLTVYQENIAKIQTVPRGTNAALGAYITYRSLGKASDGKTCPNYEVNNKQGEVKQLRKEKENNIQN